MTRQIAVRLSDDLVEFIDQLIADGHATSRAAVVARAVDRERRREIAARDLAILAGAGADADLDKLATFAARARLDDLD
jgi:Arc/MetJ-type ribon-helix-helix transcriptional regulator